MSNKPSVKPYEIGREAQANRVYQTKRTEDTFKLPKIAIYDVDYAVLYHLQQQLRIQVEDNGVAIDVPVIYASGERWTQIRKNGFLRDRTNRIMTPLISIRRGEVSPDERLPQSNLNNRRLTIKVFPNENYSNKYGETPNEFFIVDLPRYIRVGYSLTIWTQTTDQLNSIIQTIQYAHNHVWGDLYKFRTQVQSISTNVETAVGNDRIVKGEISLLVDAYLREEHEYHEPSIVRAYTISKVSVFVEGEGVTPVNTPANPVQAFLTHEQLAKMSSPSRKITRLR